MNVYCPICLSYVDSHINLNCNHKICKNCIILLLYHGSLKQCPLCRSVIDLSSITPIEIPENIELNDSPLLNVLNENQNDETQDDQINNQELNNSNHQTYVSLVRISDQHYEQLTQHILSIEHYENSSNSPNNTPDENRVRERNNRPVVYEISIYEITNCLLSFLGCGILIFILCVLTF